MERDGKELARCFFFSSLLFCSCSIHQDSGSFSDGVWGGTCEFGFFLTFTFPEFSDFPSFSNLSPSLFVKAAVTLASETKYSFLWLIDGLLWFCVCVRMYV